MEKPADTQIIGIIYTCGSLQVAEMISRSGFDWVMIDMEHSVLSLEEVQNSLPVFGEKMLRIVRVPGNDPWAFPARSATRMLKKLLSWSKRSAGKQEYHTGYSARILRRLPVNSGTAADIFCADRCFPGFIRLKESVRQAQGFTSR